jgi:hypothetical protein
LTRGVAGADIEQLGLERGHRTMTIIRKGGKVVTIPLAPRIARAIDPPVWYPASVPFPVASLVGFRITAHGKILVAILLRPGPRPTPAHAPSVPASIPVT